MPSVPLASLYLLQSVLSQIFRKSSICQDISFKQLVCNSCHVITSGIQLLSAQNCTKLLLLCPEVNWVPYPAEFGPAKEAIFIYGLNRVIKAFSKRSGKISTVGRSFVNRNINNRLVNIDPSANVILLEPREYHAPPSRLLSKLQPPDRYNFSDHHSIVQLWR